MYVPFGYRIYACIFCVYKYALHIAYIYIYRAWMIAHCILARGLRRTWWIEWERRICFGGNESRTWNKIGKPSDGVSKYVVGMLGVWSTSQKKKKKRIQKKKAFNMQMDRLLISAWGVQLYFQIQLKQFLYIRILMHPLFLFRTIHYASLLSLASKVNANNHKLISIATNI